MRTDCTQCGGRVDITGPDALARCPWCGAVARIESSGGVFHHLPALDRKQVERLFPGGSIFTPELMWFPYHQQGSGLVKAFCQPYPSLEEHEPPSGDLRPWPGVEKAGGEAVPPIPGEGRLVYHPFYSVAFRKTREGLLLDGVSGGVAGARETHGAQPGFSPRELLLWSFFCGLVPSSLIYLLIWSVSPVLAVLLSVPAGFFAARALFRLKGKT
jgi:hypothetical protein